MYSKKDVVEFARRAVDGMAESIEDMARDGGPGIEPGDYTDHVREQALDFADDILKDFAAEVIEEIKRMKFKAELKMRVDHST